MVLTIYGCKICLHFVVLFLIFLAFLVGSERKIITFLKKELENFKKILQKENKQCFVKEFNENRSSIKEAALDLSLCFLREMKQDEAADTLEGKRPTVCQIVTYRCQREN